MNSFTEHYFTTYSTKILSFQHFFCLFTYFLIFAVPFYFAFAGSNFWFQETYEALDVRYAYTGYYAIQLSYLQAADNIVQEYSNIPNSGLNGLQQVAVSPQEQEQSTQITVQLDGMAGKQIQSLNIILYYNVEIPTLQIIYSTGAAFSLPGNVNLASISGKLRVIATEPINGLTIKQSQTINLPIYYARNMASISTYDQLIQRYLSSEARIEADIHVLTSEATSQTRIITLNLLKDTNVVLPYYPSILQTLKLKFSRYMGFLILSYLIFRSIMVMLIEEEGLECHKEEQIPPVKKI